MNRFANLPHDFLATEFTENTENFCVVNFKIAKMAKLEKQGCQIVLATLPKLIFDLTICKSWSYLQGCKNARSRFARVFSFQTFNAETTEVTLRTRRILIPNSK